MIPAVTSKIVAAAIQLCAAATPLRRTHEATPQHIVFFLCGTLPHIVRVSFTRAVTHLWQVVLLPPQWPRVPLHLVKLQRRMKFNG